MTESEKISRRFLEEHFPIKEVSEASSIERGKNGHISTFHVWWARRPLASSKATIFAALVPALFGEENIRQSKFVVDLAEWEDSNSVFIQKARELVLGANGGIQPKVLDPFSGGGSIPLEALRLGCETYASDYNPVAVLLLKCILEYPQKFSSPMHQSGKPTALMSAESGNRLLVDVKRWSEKIFSQTKFDIDKLYPPDKDGSIPDAYIWARTVACQNPSCGAKIPLMRRYWLGKKVCRQVALYPFALSGIVKFKIVGTGYDKMPENFNPEKSTISKSVVNCPICGSTIDSTTLRNLFSQGECGQRLVAVVLHDEGSRRKKYRIANNIDEMVFASAENLLAEKRAKLFQKWGIDPVPDEPTPSGKGRGAERAFSIRNYNLNSWGDLFNERQKLALITLIEKMRDAQKEMCEQGLEKEYAKAVLTYIAVIFDRFITTNSSMCVWHQGSEHTEKVFAFQALSMQWSYSESNPLITGNVTGFLGNVKSVISVLESIIKIPISQPATVAQSSATELSYPDNYFDAVFTDPPYYDNVPYSYLSDFFYVWLKRSIGHLYPELFSTPLTPKSKEIVAYSNKEGGWEGGKQFFENMLKKSFTEINRVLKPNGIAVIVYAHKSTAGWETLVNSLLDSGLVITAAWPIHTEMRARLRAQNSAALSSSIYIVARKLQKVKMGIYKDVKEELQDFLCKKMDLLWKEGVSGADFLISAIGASIMVFGKYEQVLRENEVVRADVMLEDVRRIVTDYAVKQVLHNGFAAEISNLSRFYLLWRWSYGGAILPFDDARKLSQSTLVDLSHEWSKPNGVIRKEKENVCLLGPQDRNLEEIASLEKKDLIDVLHMALLLWQKGDREALVDLLSETGFGNKDSFYRVAQAISETLPKESQEKKLIEGFLAGKERLSSETKKIDVQKRLFE